jgi:flagellar L-ring protein precursor FlgH
MKTPLQPSHPRSSFLVPRTLAASFLATSFLLGGCTEAMRPGMTGLGQGLPAQGVQLPVPLAMPAAAPPMSGSLWQPGSRQFFKDSRARVVGDIVTVLVEESASANTEAKTDASRASKQQAGISVLPFISGQLATRGIDLNATGLADTNSNRDFQGDAKTNRKDSLSASVAAVVTQVLPNGLLVIQGQREVLVNYEKQQLTIQGMVRPEDITAQNTIPSSKIAEARIAYAGKGLVDESQTPQYGVRWVDKILPF